MYNKMKVIRILAIFLVFFTSCKSNNIDYVKIYYLPEGLTAQFPVNCDNLYNYKAVLKDTVIYDHKFIENLNTKINGLQENREENKSQIEIRIRCELVKNDNTKFVLCCGEFFGIILNGKRMNDDSLLLQNIKSKIY